GPQLTWADLLGMIAGALGVRPRHRPVSRRLVKAAALPLLLLERAGLSLSFAALYYPYLLTHSYYGSDKASRELGYRQRPATETLADAAAWYRAQGLL